MTLELVMQHWLLEYKCTTKFVQMMTLGWPWLFYSKDKFGLFCFCLGTCLKCRFLRNYWSLWGGSWSNKCVHDDLWQPKVKVIHLPLAKIAQIQHFRTSLPQKIPGYWSQISCGASMGCLEWKFVQMSWVAWPRWLSDSYLEKTLKNLLRNQGADDLVTW